MITYTQEEIVSSQELALSLDTYMDKVITGDVEKIAIVHNDTLSSVILSITEYERMTNTLAFLQNDPALSNLFQEQNTIANEEKQQDPLKLLYSGVDIKMDEQEKCITINPAGERFYNSGCDDLHTIFRDASLSQDADGNFHIQGVQTLYNEHNDSGMNYENLLCQHPKQLIKKRSFLGLFTYYNVNGSMKRDVKTLYVSEHKNYQIYHRLEFLSEIIEGV